MYKNTTQNYTNPLIPLTRRLSRKGKCDNVIYKLKSDLQADYPLGQSQF